MKILVTGGCGFVGSNISLFLKEKGYLVNSLDNLSRKGSTYNLKLLKQNKIKNNKFNIENYKFFKKLPKYNLIIDCCAEAAIEVSKNKIDKVINTNLIGTINILKKAKKDNSKIIYLSSSRIYPIKLLTKNYKLKNFNKKLKVKKMINENDIITGPKSIYGLTKLASEMFIEEFSYAYGMKYLINRCGVISGPLQFGKQDQGFVSLWIWQHLNKKNLSYIGYGGHGNQVRDVIHIDDVCNLIHQQIKSFTNKHNLLLNVGGGKKNAISLRELTQKCELITSNKIKFSRIKKTSIYDIPYFVSDNSQAYRLYKWKPKKNIEDIIVDTHLWMKFNIKKLKNYFK